MTEAVEEASPPAFREITILRKEAKPAPPVEEARRERKPWIRVDLHVGTTPAEKRLLKIGYLILAAMSSLLGIAALAYTFADIYWSLTGPPELRAQFQGLALMGVLTCTLAWAGAAAIGRLLLEPPAEDRQRLPKGKR